MSFDAKIFRVMIASPEDVNMARCIIRDVLAEWNAIHAVSRNLVLLPMSWETHTSPTAGDRPQAIINNQILKDADLLVGVFWTRIGTATGEYRSGTVEEIEEHIAVGKPAMLYFSDEPVRPDSVDPEQYAELKKFKESCKTRFLFEGYSDASEFREKFSRQIQLKLNHDAYFASSKQTIELPITSPQLSQEARVLLKEAAESFNGEIRYHQLFRGFMLSANGKDFVKNLTARERANWEVAVVELENNDLVKAVSHERNVFRVTPKGYSEAGKIEIPVSKAEPHEINIWVR